MDAFSGHCVLKSWWTDTAMVCASRLAVCMLTMQVVFCFCFTGLQLTAIGKHNDEIIINFSITTYTFSSATLRSSFQDRAHPISLPFLDSEQKSFPGSSRSNTRLQFALLPSIHSHQCALIGSLLANTICSMGGECKCVAVSAKKSPLVDRSSTNPYQQNEESVGHPKQRSEKKQPYLKPAKLAYVSN